MMMMIMIIMIIIKTTKHFSVHQSIEIVSINESKMFLILN
jgi:hypothetical protein